MSNEVYKNSAGQVRVVSKRRFTDLETGEQIEAVTVTKDFNSDSGFKKMFLSEILSIVDEFSNAKMKFLLWLLDNIDRNNQIIGTYEKLSLQSNISVKTISRLIPILKKAKVLKQVSIGVYMINPDIVASVKSSKRENLLIQYRKIDDK